MDRGQERAGASRQLVETSFEAADGQRLHAAILSTPSTSPSKSPAIVLLHGGGPDHQMLIPLANALPLAWTVVLPDIRGYGGSVCRDASRHTWGQYASDVIALLDHLQLPTAVVGGAGLGGTIALRVAARYPDRVRAAIIASLEAIENDAERAAEIRLMEAFAEQVRSAGIEAAWAPFLKELPPVIGAMVRNAIPRSDAESIAAAAAIAHDRSFRTVQDLAAVTAPTLIIPGVDDRHPTALARDAVAILPLGRLAAVQMSRQMRTSTDFAQALAPSIVAFLREIDDAQPPPTA